MQKEVRPWLDGVDVDLNQVFAGHVSMWYLCPLLARMCEVGSCVRAGVSSNQRARAHVP